MSQTIITRNSLTQELLKKLITYNPDTGIITRNHLPDDFKIYFRREFDFKEWNKQAGKVMYKVNIHKGRCNYHQVNISMFGFTVIAARLIFLYMTGYWPINHVDHINGVSTDNRWNNLRDVTCQENLRNQKIRKNNRSGKSGVSWRECRQKWQVSGSVTDKGVRKRIYIGSYDDLEDAIEARIHWETLQGNFSKRHQKVAPQKPYNSPN